ncbi:MAG: hypothetical protein ABII25_09935 [bacterium]
MSSNCISGRKSLYYIMIISVIFLIIGLLLIPFGIGSTFAFIEILSGVSILTKEHYYFLAGFGGYFLIHILLYKPLSMYVFGHELTHVLWTYVFGGNVKSMRVSSRGGRVVVTKSNFLINLAPYFFPIYTFFVFLIYWFFSFMFYAEKYFIVFLFLIGFSLAFHLALTFFAIRQRQSDIYEVGYVFSLSFIYVVNIFIIMLILKMIFPSEIKYMDFIEISCYKAKEVYSFVISVLYQMGNKLYGLVISKIT